MARLERIRVFPIKGLDGIDIESVDVLDGGTLDHDREFALFDSDGDVINGKRTDRIHALETDYDVETGVLTVTSPDGEREFEPTTDPEPAEHWFGEYFDCEVELRRDTSRGYVDRREMGPSVISTETIRTVADWFDDLTAESVRRRLRANLEVSGVPAFWEDRFVGEHAPTFDVGGVRIEGITPCGRCVVPQRDPDTGDSTPDFRERFVERRRETFPEWADNQAFDHYYTLMIIARIPDAKRGVTLRVGDSVTITD